MARRRHRVPISNRVAKKADRPRNNHQDYLSMGLMLTSCRKMSIGAIAILFVAAPAFAQTSPTPIPGPRLPPGVHFAPPLHPIPPNMQHRVEPEATPVPEFPPTPAQLKFAQAYVKAVNDGDAAALRKLIAPKALACFNHKNEIYLDEWIDRQLRDQIAPAYRITIEELDASDMVKTNLFTLPVMPTHQLDISTTLNGSDVTIGRPIAYQDGQWYEIAPCPTDVGVRHSIQRQQHFTYQQKQAQMLYNSLSPAFKKNLYQLLIQNQTGQACRQTSAQLKVDLQTGCRVAQVLMTAIEKSGVKETATPRASITMEPRPTPSPASKGAADQ
ncbi:MAG: hypothetical protein WBG26_06115 [Candidatus Binataceae bacterium]